MAAFDALKMLEKKQDEIRRLCEEHRVISFAVFGSAATGQFNETSDLDFLVDFDPALTATQKASAFFGLKEDLEMMFSRPVDLVTMSSLTNPYFRDSVLEERHSLYAA
ncbi:nucleotidyltransferase domain-containing protein [uncultured Marinobacter sp.]|uniref:nucleotidyltransferase family protein n=1 Tax=uncultured Marinobacter sp. TaxID=187379 RepID=UPI0030C87913